MKPFIAIDIGNSTNKAILVEGKEFGELTTEIQDLVDLGLPTIVSCVRKNLPFEPRGPVSRIFELRKENHLLEMPIHYTETIGEDRLAYAYFVFKNKNANDKILALDAGTFTTADLVTDNGLEGGWILPGIQALKQIYPQGELLQMPFDVDQFAILPHSTETAISGGIGLSAYSPIETILSHTSANQLWATGGNSSYPWPKKTRTISNGVLEGLALIGRQLFRS